MDNNIEAAWAAIGENDPSMFTHHKPRSLDYLV